MFNKCLYIGGFKIMVLNVLGYNIGYEVRKSRFVWMELNGCEYDDLSLFCVVKLMVDDEKSGLWFNYVWFLFIYLFMFGGW